MKNGLLLIVWACLFAFDAFCQVDIDKSINLSGGPGNAKVSGIKDVNAPQDALSVEALQKGSFTYGGVSAGSSTAYTFSLTPSISGYVSGMVLYFKAHTANGAGPVTINVNTQGAVTIKKNNTQDLAASDISQNQLVCLVYDGSNFNLLSRTEAADQSATNELQTISAENTGDITLSNGGGTVTLQGTGTTSVSRTGNTLLINSTDGDASTTNELQTISGSGVNDVTLSNGGGTISFAGTGLSTVSRSSNTFTINTNPLANTVTGTGTPGYAARWATSSTLGNSVVYDNGSGVGIGTTTISSKLNVSSSNAHAVLRRESTETTGGKMVFLELYQDDPSNVVPEVYPSIRFHHNNKYFNRIEGRGDGIHFKAGSITDDSYYRILAGGAYFSGNVGVGNLSPGAKLTIQRDATGAGTYDDNKTLFASGTFGSGQSFDGGVEFRHDNLTQGIGFGYNTIYQTGTNANEVLNVMSRGSGNLTLNAYSGGNVGVGTNDPAGKLHVTGGASVIQDYGIFNIGQSGTSVVTQPGLSFGYDITNNWAWMYARTVGCCGRQININNAVWVAAGGNVGVGTSSPKARLSVGDSDMLNLYQPQDNWLGIQTTLDNQSISTYGGNAENRLVLQPVVGWVGIGRGPTNHMLEVNGNTASKGTSGSWSANSDQRLKKNIVYLQPDDMLNKVLQMKGVQYEWNDDKTTYDRPEGVQYGFIAQDLQQVWPTKVTEDTEGYLQTAYGDYDFLFVESIKALNEKIEALQMENEKLKAEVRDMKEGRGVGKAERK